jgi:Sugar-transfer associated ATP-grasp
MQSVNDLLLLKRRFMTVAVICSTVSAISSGIDPLLRPGAAETDLAAEPIGRNARRAFVDFDLLGGPRHPPFRAAFYPVIQEAVVVIAIAVCLWSAGPAVRRATGKSLFRQGLEMFGLWFKEKVDPLTYYAQDLYVSARIGLAPFYLTRYETKNGLMTALNSQIKRPYVKHEMNDKSLFAAICVDAGVAHVAILADGDAQGLHWRVARESVDFDLFCKPRNGMGAKGTLNFRHVGSDTFADHNGTVLSLGEVEGRISAQKKPMLVQEWQKNHDALADLAKDSLLTVRVITCLNEKNEPEVCLAMLRLLSMLEPDWKHLPDGEYAAPIDLKTGKLGLFTGDAMQTSIVRMASHPVTGAQIEGRVLPEWDAVQSLALKLHSHVPHRAMIGWDIAVTPKGPVMLEGNNNFDVMFLQRVHNEPASASRFGTLMEFHLNNFRTNRALS